MLGAASCARTRGRERAPTAMRQRARPRRPRRSAPSPPQSARSRPRRQRRAGGQPVQVRGADARPAAAAAPGRAARRPARPGRRRCPRWPATASPWCSPAPGRRPSGGATTVVDPLSSTHAPSSAAARRACSSRRASMSAGSAPSSRPSSPACGVSSVGAARGSSSRCLASSVSPSASMSTGQAGREHAGEPPRRRVVGPHARAGDPRLHPAHVVGEPRMPGVQRSNGRVPQLGDDHLGVDCRTAAAAPAKVTSRTMPAPPATAPPVDEQRRARVAVAARQQAEHAAPVLVRLRARAREERPRCPRPAGRSPPAAGSRYGPRPMSTSSTTPAWPLPGSISSPGLTAPNVTVTSARTAGPSTSPVSASMPDGRSTATVGSRRELAASCASVAYGSRRPPLPPMPSIPSMMRSACPIACRTSRPTS